MNGKSAKALRRIARQLVANNPDSTEKLHPYEQNTVTGSIIVNPNTPRGIYRMLKKQHVYQHKLVSTKVA